MSNVVSQRDDGYTFTRGIKGEPRLYEAVEFTHRRVGIEGRADYVTKVVANEHRPDKAIRNAKITAEMIAAVVISWDAKDYKGEPIPLDPKEIIARMHPQMFDRLRSVLCFVEDGGDWMVGEDDKDQSTEDMQKN